MERTRKKDRGEDRVREREGYREIERKRKKDRGGDRVRERERKCGESFSPLV